MMPDMESTQMTATLTMDNGTKLADTKKRPIKWLKNP